MRWAGVVKPRCCGCWSGCRMRSAKRYETDAYGVYGALPANKHAVGKYGAVNRNGGSALCCAAD